MSWVFSVFWEPGHEQRKIQIAVQVTQHRSFPKTSIFEIGLNTGTENDESQVHNDGGDKNCPQREITSN